MIIVGYNVEERKKTTYFYPCLIFCMIEKSKVREERSGFNRPSFSLMVFFKLDETAINRYVRLGIAVIRLTYHQ